MSAVEFLQLAVGSGCISGGIGLLRWGLTVERRLNRLELKTNLSERS